MSDVVSRLAAAGTATVSDALDKLRIHGTALGIIALADGQRLSGRAFTVRYVPADLQPGTVGDYIDDVEPGSVVVLDNAGRCDCTVWGDILTGVAHRRGVGGTVIDGVCRDTWRALDVGYPIYSRGRYMRTGKDRVEVAEMGGTVTIGGVHVRQGDILVGDDDGVVIVPAARESEIADIADEIATREDEILAAATASGSLRAAREKFGYHQLQRSTEQ